MHSKQDQYRDWIKDKKELPLFFQAWWLDIVCGGAAHWDVVLSKKKDETQGVFCFYKKTKFLQTYITQPPLTPVMGPWLVYPNNVQKRHSRYSFEQRVLEDLAHQLPSYLAFKQKWHWQIENYLPFYNRAYRAQLHYTYLWNNLNNKEEIWGNLANNVRGRIRQQQEHFEIKEMSSIAATLDLQNTILRNNGVKKPLDSQMVQLLWQAIQKYKGGKIFSAFDKDTYKLAASILVVYDQKEAYLLMSGQIGRAHV